MAQKHFSSIHLCLRTNVSAGYFTRLFCLRMRKLIFEFLKNLSMPCHRIMLLDFRNKKHLYIAFKCIFFGILYSNNILMKVIKISLPDITHLGLLLSNTFYFIFLFS